MHGPKHPEAPAALELLAAVRPGGCGGDPRRAFELLVELGWFPLDANLHLLRAGLPRDFSPELREEARALAALPLDASLPFLETGPILAIDDAETLDVDDALAVERVPGATILHVLIADVAGRVPLESACGHEAGRRCSTIYLPEGTVPMLPPELAEGALGLHEGAERQAVDFRITLNEEGRPYDLRIGVCRIRVDRQLTYARADALLAGSETDPDPRVGESLRHLHALATAARRMRHARGGVIWQPERFKVRADADGRPTITPIPPDSRARALVGELMILAGALVADYCVQHAIPAIYRAQDCAPFHGTRGDLDQRPSTSGVYGLLRGMRPATLRTTPSPHAGLGVDAYLQVTSPIRRFQDLLAHVQLRAHALRRAPPLAPRDLLELLSTLEETHKAQAKVMRAGTRYWILKHYEALAPHRVEAEVIGEVGREVRLFLRDTGLQELWAPDHRLVLGEIITVEVLSADPRADRLLLRSVPR